MNKKRLRKTGLPAALDNKNSGSGSGYRPVSLSKCNRLVLGPRPTHQSIGAERSGLFCRSAIKPISVISAHSSAPAPRPPAPRSAPLIFSTSVHRSAPLQFSATHPKNCQNLFITCRDILQNCQFVVLYSLEDINGKRHDQENCLGACALLVVTSAIQSSRSAYQILPQSTTVFATDQNNESPTLFFSNVVCDLPKCHAISCAAICWPRIYHKPFTASTIKVSTWTGCDFVQIPLLTPESWQFVFKQVAQLSQRNRATLYVIQTCRYA